MNILEDPMLFIDICQVTGEWFSTPILAGASAVANTDL